MRGSLFERHWETALIIPKAIARAEFTDITDEVLERGLEIVNESIKA